MIFSDLTLLILFAAIAAASVFPILVEMGRMTHSTVRAFRQYRDTRVVFCPMTTELGAVQLETGNATLAAGVSSTDLKVRSCSRWQESGQCDQQCVKLFP